VVYYTADSGEAKELTITREATGFHFEDSGAVITPGSGCSAVSAHEVTCEALLSTDVSVRVEDLDDFVFAQGGGVSIDGGLGNDVIIGTDGGVSIAGGPGDDLIFGERRSRRP
jgi:Ca2+-binding RTX toxin-like protein